MPRVWGRILYLAMLHKNLIFTVNDRCSVYRFVPTYWDLYLRLSPLQPGMCLNKSPNLACSLPMHVCNEWTCVTWVQMCKCKLQMCMGYFVSEKCAYALQVQVLSANICVWTTYSSKLWYFIHMTIKVFIQPEDQSI